MYWRAPHLPAQILARGSKNIGAWMQYWRVGGKVLACVARCENTAKAKYPPIIVQSLARDLPIPAATSHLPSPPTAVVPPSGRHTPTVGPPHSHRRAAARTVAPSHSIDLTLSPQLDHAAHLTSSSRPGEQVRSLHFLPVPSLWPSPPSPCPFHRVGDQRRYD
jgi:hypothetical protein